MAAPIVFLDMAGPDEAALRGFYETVFDWPCGTPTTFAPGNAANLDMTIRQDPAEKLFYIGVPDVTAALASIEAAGGKTDVSRFVVSVTVVLVLFFVSAGNRMGLVEMNDDTPVIP